MNERFERTAMLIGEEGLERLEKSSVMVFGIGGVGGHAVDALARAGIGEFHLIDSDVVSITNINRQIIASEENVDRKKVDVAKDRILSINPHAIVHTYPVFYLPDNHEDIDLRKADFVLDCIDTVTAKIDIIAHCAKLHVPLISALGCGNRLDPEKLRITDIHKTSMDPLAKVVRKKCRELGIKSLPVVYSEEKPIKPLLEPSASKETGKRSIPGSVSFVPSVAGLMMAGYVVRKLCGCMDKSE